MSNPRRQHNADDRRRGIGPFWWGVLAGAAITVAVFHKFIFELLADATGNVMPVVFTPGLLEFTLAVLGFSAVVVINHLLKREQRDEWVEMEVGDDGEPGDQ